MKSLSQFKIFFISLTVFILPLSFNACKGFESVQNTTFNSEQPNNFSDNSDNSDNKDETTLNINIEATLVTYNIVELSWTHENNGSYSYSYSYSIFRNGELLDSVSNLSFTDTNVSQNTQYTYRVYAVDTLSGESVGDSSITVTTEVNLPTEKLIFFDDLDTDPISNHWAYLNSVNVSANNSKSGNRALEFYFKGGDENTDSHAEARFDLGAKYSELTIVFDLFVPSNFNHRNAPGPDNNKFLRLWTNTYNDLEKVGVSTWSQANGGSAIGEDFVLRQYSSMSTMITSRSDWISASDKGKWMSVKIYIKVSNDKEPGQIKLYKNGSLFHENTQIDNNHIMGEQGLQFGYLLGWANSGFAEDTYMYIDNVAFYSGKLEN